MTLLKHSVLFVLLCFSFNVFAQNFYTKNGGNCYTLEVPNYMTKTYDLNDVATLQYKNIVKEAYTIVIEDSKDELTALGMIFENSTEFLENFTNDYQTDKEDRTLSSAREFQSNGQPHAQVEMTWTSEEIPYYMLVTVVETEKHFYKILCWTLLENKDKLKNNFLTMSQSLKD